MIPHLLLIKINRYLHLRYNEIDKHDGYFTVIYRQNVLTGLQIGRSLSIQSLACTEISNIK